MIEHTGSACPVPSGTIVRVDLGDGEVYAGPADEWHWGPGLGDDGAGRILRYEVLLSAGSKPSNPKDIVGVRKAKAMILPADPAERKGLPITTGVLDYFPLAMAEVARVSKAGNDQHNPGQPLHWAKEKSTDHADCIPRHLIDRYSRDADGQRHAAKMAWRSLAFLETLLEDEAKGAAARAP